MNRMTRMRVSLGIITVAGHAARIPILAPLRKQHNGDASTHGPGKQRRGENTVEWRASSTHEVLFCRFLGDTNNDPCAGSYVTIRSSGNRGGRSRPGLSRFSIVSG